MLTIAGGIVLGFFAIMVILAILSNEDLARGCGILVLWVVGLVVALGLLWLAVVIWEEKAITVIGGLLLMSVASWVMGQLYDAVDRWRRKLAARRDQGEQPPSE